MLSPQSNLENSTLEVSARACESPAGEGFVEEHSQPSISTPDGAELEDRLAPARDRLEERMAQLQALLARNRQEQLTHTAELESRFVERLYGLQKQLAVIEEKIDAIADRQDSGLPNALFWGVALLSAIAFTALLLRSFPVSPVSSAARILGPQSNEKAKADLSSPRAQCPQERAIPTQITIVNRSQHPVSLHWLNENCQEIRTRTIAPQTQWTQHTYATQSWRIRDRATGQSIQQIIPNTAAPTIVEIAPRSPTITDKPRRPL